MSTTFERRELTAAIKTQLQSVEVGDPAHPGSFLPVLVGNGSIPLGAGWRGQPDDTGSVFVPYFVLTTATASPAADTGSMGRPQEDWHVPYVIQSFGVTHDQAEWLADKGRTALAPMRNEIFQCGASKYKVQQVWTSQIGGVTRVPMSDPPFFGQQDGVTLWMAKRRTP